MMKKNRVKAVNNEIDKRLGLRRLYAHGETLCHVGIFVTTHSGFSEYVFRSAHCAHLQSSPLVSGSKIDAPQIVLHWFKV